MKNLSIIALLSLALGFMSCSDSAKTFTLTGNISGVDGDSLQIASAAVSEIATIAIDSQGDFTAEIPTSVNGVFNVMLGRKYASFYAQPGDNVSLSADAKDFEQSLTFTGSNEKENNYLAAKSIFNKSRRASYDMMKLAELPQEQFFQKLDEKYSQNTDLLADTFAEGGNDNFLALERKNIEMAAVSDKLMYPGYYNYINKSEEAFADDYYDFLNEVDINDADLTQFPSGLQILGEKITRMAPKSDYATDGPAQYFLGQFDKVKNNVTSKAVQKALLFQILNQKLSYGGGMDGITDEVDHFLSIADNDNQIAEINKMVAVWEKLKKGADAPLFSGVTTAGEMVNISDLKGKSVYVDVWATWCGPCKAEIPSLKKVEHDYSDKNIEFVSISIDELKDKDKWLKFVLEEELGGTQIMGEDAWKSEIVTAYEIKGIPRFLLIDDKGKIVSADAPRPSSETLRELLDETIG